MKLFREALLIAQGAAKTSVQSLFLSLPMYGLFFSYTGK
jgi:hypothetical protein